LGRHRDFVFVELADGDPKMLPTVVGILLLVMLLNLIGMLLARRIVAAVDIMTFQVVGWIFAVLQAASRWTQSSPHCETWPCSAPTGRLRRRGGRTSCRRVRLPPNAACAAVRRVMGCGSAVAKRVLELSRAA
jgi:hypothetical protein